VSSIRITSITPEEPLNSGFDFSVTRLTASLENGGEFCIVIRFAYGFDQYKGKVAIKTIRDLEHLDKNKI